MSVVLNHVNRKLLLAKLIFAPLGAGMLVYWAAQERSSIISESNVLLIAGCIVSLLSVIPFALRFRRVLKVFNLEVPQIEALRIITQSMFYYFFVPLSVGTEVSKYAKLKHALPSASSARIASAIVTDHMVGLFILALGSSALFALLNPISIDWNYRIVMGLLIFSSLGLALAYYNREKIAAFDHRVIWRHLRTKKADLTVALVLSASMHFFIALAVFLGARHLQIDVSFLEIMFVLTGAFLFQMIPINIIGVSAVEIAGAGLYLAIGLTTNEALLLVSLLYCYRILIALFGGIWEFVGTSVAGRSLRAE